MVDQIASSKITKDQFHIERSRFLDAFADVEQATIRLCARLAIKPGVLTFGQRIEELRKIKANPQLSKPRVAEIVGMAERLGKLNELRADIVHSHMRVAPIDGQTQACFINSRNCGQEFQSARLLTLEQFGKLITELANSALQVAKLGPNPPASPPPPSPGGATDP